MGLGSFLKKAAGIALPIAGSAIGGPIGGAIGSTLSSVISGGDPLAGLLGGLGGGSGGGSFLNSSSLSGLGGIGNSLLSYAFSNPGTGGYNALQDAAKKTGKYYDEYLDVGVGATGNLKDALGIAPSPPNAAEAEKFVRDVLGYKGEVGGGKVMDWINAQPSLRAQYDTFRQPGGNAPNATQAVNFVRSIGYTGPIGGGKTEAWLAKNPAAKAKFDAFMRPAAPDNAALAKWLRDKGYTGDLSGAEAWLDAQPTARQRYDDFMNPKADTAGGINSFLATPEYRLLFGDPATTGEDYDPVANFRGDPAYEFVLGEGLGALDRSAISKGMLRSGTHSQDLIKFGQDYADTNYQNYLNRLSGSYSNYLRGLQAASGFVPTAAAAMGDADMAAAQAYAAQKFANADRRNNLLGTLLG